MADISLTIGLDTIVGDSAAKIMGVVSALESYANKLLDAAQAGDAFADAAAAFRGDLESLQRATGGEVRALDLMQASNRAMMRGLQLSDAELEKAVGAMKKLTDATGEDMVGALDGLFTALATGRTMGLRRYGIEVDSSASKAEKLASAIRQLEERAASFADSADNAGDAATRFRTSLADLGDQFSLGVAQSEAMTASLSLLAEATGTTASGGEVLGETFATIIAGPLGAATTMFERFRRGVDEATLREEAMQAETERLAQSQLRLAAATREANLEFERQAAAAFAGGMEGEPAPSASRLAAQAEVAARPTRRRRAGGGARGRDVRAEQEERLREEAAAAREFQTQFYAERREAAASFEADMLEIRRRGAESQAELEHEQAMQRAAEQRESHALLLEEEEEFAARRMQQIQAVGFAAAEGALQVAGAAGLGAAEQMTFEGMLHAGKAVAAGLALNPALAIAEGAAAAASFLQAAKIKSRAKRHGARGGAGGGEGGGGGAGVGAAGAFAGGGGGGGQVGGEGVTVILNITNSTSGDHEWQEQLHRALVRHHRRTGAKLPAEMVR